MFVNIDKNVAVEMSVRVHLISVSSIIVLLLFLLSDLHCKVRASLTYVSLC